MQDRGPGCGNVFSFRYWSKVFLLQLIMTSYEALVLQGLIPVVEDWKSDSEAYDEDRKQQPY